MSAHGALRLAVRPLRRVAFADQLATTAAAPRSKPVSPSSALTRRRSVCLRCSVAAVDIGAGPGVARARLFSTAPPPPRQPPPPWQLGPGENKPSPKPETTTPNHAPFTSPPTPPPPTPTSPPPKQPEQPKQPEPQPAAPSTAASSSPASPDPQEAPLPENGDPSLPSFTETHRHPLSARFSTFMDKFQSRALTATQRINDLTGYSAIEAIKSHNAQLEHDHATSQRRLRNARSNYKSLNAHRAATQREVTTLLARQATWTPADLERFTALYRLDHELETQVTAASAELTEAETDESRLSGELNAGILKRYHEEQIWSDRIRRQSTWGTWGLMGVNVVLFLVLQFVAEPWRRKRLINGVAESEKGVMDEVKRELGEVRAALEASGLREAAAAAVVRAADEAAATTVQAVPVEGEGVVVAAAADMAVPIEAGRWEPARPPKPWKELLMDYWEDPELLREAVLDLSSNRRIDLRMRDATAIALQGAAAGAAVAVVLVFALVRGA